MARITVEDCLQYVTNRFELVIVAAKRARQLEMDGADPLVPWENDKPTVVALREIASSRVDGRILDEDYNPSSGNNLTQDLPVSSGETGEVV